MATEPQAPVNTTLNRKYQCAELILTQKMWDRGREKQASKLAEQLQQRNSSNATPAKAHGNAPADLPAPPTRSWGNGGIG